ncbi:MAG: hypothetical protein FWD27_00075 [Coriobacteriia bacterium]|nr:hypothetical protein [Coriobacteriia bacterium]
MTSRRLRLLIIVLAFAVIATSSLAVYQTFIAQESFASIEPYSDRYTHQSQSVSTNAGVFRERDYHAAASSEIATPANGKLIINPIQADDQGEESPRVQFSSYFLESSFGAPLYTRITNSRRSDKRTGQVPDVAVLTLEYSSHSNVSSWQSLTIYNTASSEDLVDSALIFAPALEHRATTWQHNVSLILVDGVNTSHAAALLPGVNILNSSSTDGRASGVIYTNRPFAIGSLPSHAQDSKLHNAFEAARKTGSLSSAATLGMDISQRITGTDLIFTAPSGKEIISSIQAPVSNSGVTNSLSIEGGVVAIDRGVTLVIGSGELGRANSILGRSEEGAPVRGTLNLSPHAIIVDGGTLVLSNATAGSISINSSIQVRNGGILKIGENVAINGNIYAFGGGSVEVLASFTLNGSPVPLAISMPTASSNEAQTTIMRTTERAPGGIYIFGGNCVLADGTALGSGKLHASLLWLIGGGDGFNQFFRSNAVHFLSTQAPLGYRLMYSDYCCSNAHAQSYYCMHLGSLNEDGEPYVEVSLSDDCAVIEAFVFAGLIHE